MPSPPFVQLTSETAFSPIRKFDETVAFLLLLKTQENGYSTESRRAEVIVQFLSEVLLLHLIKSRQYKARWNFMSSNFVNTRHVIYLGVT